MKNSLRDNVGSFSLSNVLRSKQSASSDLTQDAKRMYWVKDLEFARLTIAQETPDPTQHNDIFVNANTMKKLASGNDEIKCKKSYDRSDTTVKIDTTFVIKGKYPLTVRTNDLNEHSLQLLSITQLHAQDKIH